MKKAHTFKFLDDKLNRELVRLLERAGIEHSRDEDGVIHYAAQDQDRVDNDLICSLRARVFPSWQVLTCPPDWTAQYRDYMRRHEIPFQEELSDGARWFLIPRKHRPHSWKLEAARPKQRLTRS